MRIAEIFRSIQGEGRLTGTDSIFLRTSGCNLRCRYCDTPYASWRPEGEDLSVEEILSQIEELASNAKSSRSFLPDAKLDASPHMASSTKVSHVVLTGGEPMLFAELIPLASRLRRQGMHITVETSGTLHLPLACDLMSISPKLSNSTPPPEQDSRWTWRHELAREAPDVIRRLVAEYDYQMKFVIDKPQDCLEVETYLSRVSEVDRERVMLMPEGTSAEELAKTAGWLEHYCQEQGLEFCPRRQIEWFGQVRGT